MVIGEMDNSKYCLNTRGCYHKEAKYIKEINSSNFCSLECYYRYTGRKKPSIPERKIFADPERQQLHDLYRWALGTEKPDWVKQKEGRPKPDEWIVTLSNCVTYLLDDFDRRFVWYKLGKGIFDGLLRLITDENSDYYRKVIDRINEVQCNPELINRNVTAIQKKRGVKQGTKRGCYGERTKAITITCKGCGRNIEITSKRKRMFCSESCRRRYWRNHKKEKGKIF
jgi:hypothetical protein